MHLGDLYYCFCSNSLGDSKCGEGVHKDHHDLVGDGKKVHFKNKVDKKCAFFLWTWAFGLELVNL